MLEDEFQLLLALLVAGDRMLRDPKEMCQGGTDLLDQGRENSAWWAVTELGMRVTPRRARKVLQRKPFRAAGGCRGWRSPAMG